MRGYLQRLAASVSRPERRLRPLAGSIFFGELHEENVEEVRRPPAEQPAREPAARSTEAAMQRPEAARVSEPSDDSVRETQQVVRASPPEIKVPSRSVPLLSPQFAPAERLQRETQESVIERLAPPSAAATSDEAPERPAVPFVNRVSSQPLVLRPLVVEEGRAEAAEFNPQPVARREPLPTPRTHPRRQEREAHPAAARKSERNTGEEVQIHIGRIEVIAATPPSPRAAASATSRSTSLEDYLSRRNGRVR